MSKDVDTTGVDLEMIAGIPVIKVYEGDSWDAWRNTYLIPRYALSNKRNKGRTISVFREIYRRVTHEVNNPAPGCIFYSSPEIERTRFFVIITQHGARDV